VTRSTEKVHGCPGTGKTTTLLQRVNLLVGNGYYPNDITLTTFRRTTATELKDDTKEIFNGVQVGTLHHICRELLGKPAIMGTVDNARFGLRCGYSISGKDYTEDMIGGNPIDCYSWLRNTFTPIDEYYLYPGFDAVSDIDMDKFILEYEAYKQEAGKVDFTDLLTMVLDDKITLNTTVLMVDEYQDLTPLQDAVIRMWESETDYTIIAGDPGQAIYGVFGGRPELFNNWKADTNTVLHESRRLYTPVWDLARETLAMERQDTPKIVTSEAPHNPIQHMSFDDHCPVHPGTELHLVRCNYQAPAIAMQLAETGRPFSGLGGWTDTEVGLFNVILKMRSSDIITRKEIKDVLLKYYPGQVSIKAEDLNDYRATDKPPFTKALYDIMRTPNPIAYIKDVGTLLNLKISRALKLRNTPITSKDLQEIRLLTIHGAKGTEADTVFLHSGITPKIRKAIAIPGPESEAEARVWYVGITRAKEWLYIVQDKGRNYELPVVVS
jgi:superfamily I DNA/RNA helicase